MPRKFSSFFTSQDEKPDWGDDYRWIHPDFGPLILKTLAAHAAIDSARSIAFLCMFQDQAHMAALTYNRLMVSGNLSAVMDAAAEAYLPLELLDFYYGVKRLTSETDKSRNALAHSYYMGSPIIGDAGVLLMSPRHWVLRSGEAVTVASRKDFSAGGSLAKWDRPFSPDEMMVYGRGDFEAMQGQMSRAQDAWLAFAKWVWPTVCPVEFEDAKQFLVSQETIMRVVDARRKERGEHSYQP